MGKSPVSSGGSRAARALCFVLFVFLAFTAAIHSYVVDILSLKTYIYLPKDMPSDNNTPANNNSTNRKLLEYYKIKVEHNINNLITLEQNRNLSEQNSTTLVQNRTDWNTSRPSAVNNLEDVENNKSKLPLCTLSNGLGPVSVNKLEVPAIEDIEKKYPQLCAGGIYNLSVNCDTQDKVAIIVPFRNRHQHLAQFLNHMHLFLMNQQGIAYGIYVVEQKGTRSFNRGKLFNVGSVEAQKLSNNYWKCFVFHDVDLLPLDSRNLYTCPRQPRHMSVAVDTMGFRLSSKVLFGGVSALTAQQFQHVNGFPNRYWGWGGEDDDMFRRLKNKSYEIARYKSSIARYAMLNHEQATPNPNRFKLLSKTIMMLDKDGLSNLDYKVVHVQKFHLFTLILANIN